MTPNGLRRVGRGLARVAWRWIVERDNESGRELRRWVGAAPVGRAYQANGKREVERRQRQIAAGQLTVANGLVVAAHG